MIGARDYARDALIRHLEDFLPAELAARDQRRRAQVVCSRGPYEIPEDAILIIDGEEVELEAGTRTAETLAGELEIEGVEASADADGRLVLQCTTAPGEGGASILEVGPGSANRALGLRPGAVVEIPLSNPEIRIYDHGPDMGRVDLTGPTICLVESQMVPQRERESVTVRVRLELFVPGPQAEDRATLRAVSELVAAIDAVIAEGDGRGRWMIGGLAYPRILRCYPQPWRVRDHVWQLADGRVARPYGRAQPEYEIRVWHPVGD